MNQNSLPDYSLKEMRLFQNYSRLFSERNETIPELFSTSQEIHQRIFNNQQKPNLDYIESSASIDSINENSISRHRIPDWEQSLDYVESKKMSLLLLRVRLIAFRKCGI